MPSAWVVEGDLVKKNKYYLRGQLIFVAFPTFYSEHPQNNIMQMIEL